MTAVLLLTAWAFIVAFPDHPAARVLRRWSVDWPAARLARLGRGHVAVVLTCLLLATMVVWIGEADGAQLLAMGAPEFAAWLSTFEVATLVDLGIAAVAAWGSLRAQVVQSMFRRSPRRRRLRTPRPRPASAANDDDRRWAWAM